MLGRTNTGGGGSGGLNFQVIGGTTAPSNPKENMIWVNTSTKITSYIFSATQPTGSAGMVWISTGTSSTTEFNALKKNGIQVYPISAKQYVSGAWVDKEVKSYQNGAWIDWIPEGTIYLNGNQFEKLTGGWKKSALTWSGMSTGGSISYDEYLTVKAGSGQYYDATTENKFDLTEYSEIRFDIAPDSSMDDQLVVIHNKSSGTIFSSGTPAWVGASNNGVLPLTGISGLYYIAVLSTNNRTVKVGNIRLVK